MISAREINTTDLNLKREPRCGIWCDRRCQDGYRCTEWSERETKCVNCTYFSVETAPDFRKKGKAVCYKYNMSVPFDKWTTLNELGCIN